MKKVKLLILAEARSSHTIKWVSALAEQNFSICLFSLYAASHTFPPEVQLVSLDLDEQLLDRNESQLKKFIYIKAIVQVRKLVKQFKPDIVHSHFLSSYGFLGAISGYHPFVASVWGSDIFSFPKKSTINRKLIDFTLGRADKILSTSFYMAEDIKKYTDKAITVTPFGIDLSKFKPIRPKDAKTDLVIGIIKGLEKVYGHPVLIEAFRILKNNNPDKKLKLKIVGDGTEKESLQHLVNEYNLTDTVEFTGKIDYSNIEFYHNEMDIEVYPSIGPESFGVSVLEASACEKAVIITRVGGMPETVSEGETGFIINPNNVPALVDKLQLLLDDEGLRKKMGIAGRSWVRRNFDFDKNEEQMIEIYNNLLL